MTNQDSTVFINDADGAMLIIMGLIVIFFIFVAFVTFGHNQKDRTPRKK